MELPVPTTRDTRATNHTTDKHSNIFYFVSPSRGARDSFYSQRQPTMNLFANNDHQAYVYPTAAVTRDDPASALPAPRGITPDDHPSLTRTSSKTIPIATGSSSHRRSESELQLQESEMLAEQRDYCMYMRIVNGMSSSSSSSCSGNSRRRSGSEDCLANVIKTRHTPILDGHFCQLQDRYHESHRYQHHVGTKHQPSHHEVHAPSLWYAQPRTDTTNTILYSDADYQANDHQQHNDEADEAIFDMEM